MNTLKKLIFIIVFFVSMAAIARAGSVSDNMTVTVNYTPSCDISLNNIDFGTTDAIMDANGIVSGSVNIDVTCSNGLPYTVKILLASDTIDMSNGSKKLVLSFYDNNTGTSGQYTAAANQIGGSRTGIGEKQTITNAVYARVRPNQTDCSSTTGGKWLCSGGVYTANTTFRVSF